MKKSLELVKLINISSFNVCSQASSSNDCRFIGDDSFWTSRTLILSRFSPVTASNLFASCQARCLPVVLISRFNLVSKCVPCREACLVCTSPNPWETYCFILLRHEGQISVLVGRPGTKDIQGAFGRNE